MKTIPKFHQNDNNGLAGSVRRERNVLIQVALTLAITVRLRLKLLRRLPMSVLFECRLTTNVKQLLSGIGAEFSTNIGE